MELEIMDTINTVSEIELIYKSKVPPSKRPKVTNAKDAFDIFIKYWDKNRIDLVEQFYAMFQNANGKVLAIYPLSTGGISGTVVDQRLLFAAALKLAASSILLCHNHPSGNTKPSNADLETTAKIKAGGDLLNIRVLDHLIITGEHEYFSLAENGMM